MRVTVCIGSSCHIKGSRQEVRQSISTPVGVNKRQNVFFEELRKAFFGDSDVHVVVDRHRHAHPIALAKAKTACENNLVFEMAIFDLRLEHLHDVLRAFIRHCPVKAIRFSGNQAHIIGDECILCGHCFVVCPQNAKEIVNETEKARVLINIANYEGVGIGAMRDALKQLGFADVEETALGATVVKNEYERLLREEKRDIVISSCCHTVNLLIQKYFPNELPYLADVLSPMQAHCADIKKRHPGAKTVFIGPCVAKKDEASHYQGIVDAVLTYEELTEWLNKEGITLKHEGDDTEESRARFFPTTGGILKTMSLDAPCYDYMAIDGIENCISALKDIEQGNIHHAFIEMSSCVGSCVGGPVMEKYHPSPVREYLAVANYAGKKDFKVDQPDQTEIRKHFTFIERERKMPTEEENDDAVGRVVDYSVRESFRLVFQEGQTH